MGILTALLGGPFFLWLLLARKRVGGYCVEPYRFRLGQMDT